MRKTLSLLTAVVLSAGLFSCGGGGGDESSSTSSSGERVIAKVEASIVKGATVCVENTNICNQTDDNGTVSLQVSHLPVNLTVKVGDVVLGDVEADSPYVPITPLDIAGGNNQLAEKIGAFIHALAGDVNGTAHKIDLTKIKVNLKENLNKPLVEILKSGNNTESLSIEVENDEGVHTVEIDEFGIKHDEEVVQYDISNIQMLSNYEKMLRQFVKFVFKYNGKTVAFYDFEEQNSTCILRVNPANPLQFKFTNCSNPDDNDSTWETAFVDKDGVKIVDEDGLVSYLLDVDLKDGEVKYKTEGENGNWITGELVVMHNYQESQQNQTEEQFQENETYQQNWEEISNNTLLEKTIEFLEEYSGKKVSFGDDTCLLKINPENPYQFKFTNCLNPDDNDWDWENISLESGDIVKIEDEDGAVAYVLEVNLEEGKLKYKTQNENGEWYTGWLVVE